ncbi:nuclear transport factor 2 family protein [Streptomyces mirabilis]|uniref:nuclear transport factor 2 family protein n=1 Tax=Streptomyces mirabilis TaxID=68239 RepID=UPI0021C0294A|nr:nuclear transport factor 2 family protein [Streptomyces mirabilis]MCT9113451.1 nuclear transport factor 2 family protein [Streptomyces mirabilis]
MNNPEPTSIEDRLRVIEDRLAIYNLLAAHPYSTDTGERSFIESIYTEDFVFDRGPGLDGASGRDSMVALVECDAHRTAIAGGLAHFGNLPLAELHGDTAEATSYIAFMTPDDQDEPRELANHGTSTGFRIHRVIANRWSLVRTDGRWSIASRTVLPMDGTGPALELLHQASTYYTQR